MSQSSSRRVFGTRTSVSRLAGDGTSPWISGIWSGVQALVWSFLLVVLPVVAAFVATSGSATNAEVGWMQSVALGVHVWLLGHGGTIATSVATISIVPLGFMMAVFAINIGSVRRTAVPQLEAGIAHTLSYAVGLGLLGMLGPAGRGGIVRAVLGALVLAGLAAVLGITRVRRDADPAGLVAISGESLDPLVGWERSLRQATPAWVTVGLRGALIPVAGVIGAGALLAFAWIILGRETISTLMFDLHADPIGAVALTLGQIILVPNLIMWAVAWIVGTGFSVGAGTMWSPFEVTAAPLPAIPLLGALPQTGGSPMTGPWLVALPLLAGALAGWFIYRAMIAPVLATRKRDDGSATSRSMRAPEFPRWRESFGAAAITACGSGLLILVLSGLAGGVSGPERLEVVGASSLVTAAVFAAEVFIGLVIFTVATRPETTRMVGGWFGRRT